MMLYKVPRKLNGECHERIIMSSYRPGNSISGAVKVKKEIPDDFGGVDLDHIVLKERRQMLLTRQKLGLAKPGLEDQYGASSNLVSNCGIQRSAEIGALCTTRPYSASAGICPENESSKLINFNDDQENGGVLSYLRSSTSARVKEEPVENGDCSSGEIPVANLSIPTIRGVKDELVSPYESHDDWVDHMSLRDRMKLLASSGEVTDLNIFRNLKCLRKVLPSSFEYGTDTSEPTKHRNMTRPRKRKRTATDSVETALEEDAPGLLQVLIEKGVVVDEIKLYGEPESDDALDFSEESFSELEAVISKLFFQCSSSLLKFDCPVKFAKASQVSYCLACLISLVEQTRYLQSRNWPVEWGWCRDLQSFIFVFERHNRIVLERPEYGYATYFFELVDSLPVDWQIKRLVTAMKLTSCSRISLIENRPLLVGEDLTEGEAKVLMEYGWIPNSGLGTMLNYCDRVVHDRKNDKESSEWRSKIGKMLVNGYNSGVLVSNGFSNMVVEYSGHQSPEIKQEV